MLPSLLVALALACAARVHGLDNDFRCEDFDTGACGGSSQSPINVIRGQRSSLARNRVVKLDLPTVSDTKLINKGTALQVCPATARRACPCSYHVQRVSSTTT